MTPAHAPLFFVVGASGAGKDSVLAYARDRAADLPVAFAHRYITRPANSGGENHVALTHEEFERRLGAGLFSLAWQANDNAYGIGSEIDAWMRAGLTVVANGSRGYLPVARQRYPGLIPVLIRVRPATLARRLRKRGRETEEQIQKRLQRAALLDDPPAECIVLDNDGPLHEAGDALLALLRGACAHLMQSTDIRKGHKTHPGLAETSA